MKYRKAVVAALICVAATGLVYTPAHAQDAQALAERVAALEAQVAEYEGTIAALEEQIKTLEKAAPADGEILAPVGQSIRTEQWYWFTRALSNDNTGLGSRAEPIVPELRDLTVRFYRVRGSLGNRTDSVAVARGVLRLVDSEGHRYAPMESAGLLCLPGHKALEGLTLQAHKITHCDTVFKVPKDAAVVHVLFVPGG